VSPTVFMVLGTLVVVCGMVEAIVDRFSRDQIDNHDVDVKQNGLAPCYVLYRLIVGVVNDRLNRHVADN
jgi:hypothetical protein